MALLPKGPAAELLAEEPRVRLAGHLAADGHARAGIAPVSFTRSAAALVAPPGSGTETLPGIDEFTLAVPERRPDQHPEHLGPGEPDPQHEPARRRAHRERVRLHRSRRPDARARHAARLRRPTPSTSPPCPSSRPDADPDPHGPAAGSSVEWLINFFDSLVNRYAVLGDDTLPKIAARFGLGLAELIPAVADIPGLLVAGTPLALPGGTYTAGSTDTLRADRHRPLGTARGRGGRRVRVRRRAHRRDAAAAGGDLSVRPGRRGLRVPGRRDDHRQTRLSRARSSPDSRSCCDRCSCSTRRPTSARTPGSARTWPGG